MYAAIGAATSMLLLRHFVEQLVSVLLLLPLAMEDEAVATAAAPAG
jgi:hypothetical protein